MAETRRRRRGSTLAERPSWNMRTCCIEPLCNVHVTANEVLVTADLPSADPGKIRVEQVSKRTLEIKAEMTHKIHFKEFGITHRQGEFQFLWCQTHIPVPVDATSMKKELKRGILEVHLPRKRTIK